MDPVQLSRQFHGCAPDRAHRTSSTGIRPNFSSCPPNMSSYPKQTSDPLRFFVQFSKWTLSSLSGCVSLVSTSLFALPEIYILCMSQGNSTPSAALTHSRHSACLDPGSTTYPWPVSGHTRTHMHMHTHTHTFTCVLCIKPIQVHTHLEQWAADAAAPGEQLGVRCLAQGSHLSHGQFLPEPRFEPTTSVYKSNAL